MQEAIIGTTFVLAASGALLLLAANPHGGEHLKDLLVGQILWVNWPRLLPVALVYAVILVLWFGMRERIGRIGFYLAVRGRGDGFGAARRPLPRVHDADRAGARDAPVAPRAARALLCAGRCAATPWACSRSAVFDLPSGAVIVWAMALLAIPVFAYGARRSDRTADRFSGAGSRSNIAVPGFPDSGASRMLLQTESGGMPARPLRRRLLPVFLAASVALHAAVGVVVPPLAPDFEPPQGERAGSRSGADRAAASVAGRPEAAPVPPHAAARLPDGSRMAETPRRAEDRATGAGVAGAEPGWQSRRSGLAARAAETPPADGGQDRGGERCRRRCPASAPPTCAIRRRVTRWRRGARASRAP